MLRQSRRIDPRGRKAAVGEPRERRAPGSAFFSIERAPNEALQRKVDVNPPGFAVNAF